MNPIEDRTADQYHEATDEIRVRLVDDSLKALGRKKWIDKFGIEPEQARKSRSCVKTEWFTVWGIITCNNPETAKNISKATIDRLKTVTAARDVQIRFHQRKRGQTSEQIKSNEQHQYFNARLKDLTRMFAKTFDRHHPVNKSGVSLANDIQGLSQNLEVLRTGDFSDGVDSSSDPLSSQDSPLIQNDGLVKPEMASESQEDETTQADVDGSQDPLLDGYCEYVCEVRSAVLQTWSRYLEGKISAMNAAIVANFGLHLMEIRTNEVIATTDFESTMNSPENPLAGNSLWKAISKLHNDSTVLIRNSKKGSNRERVLRTKNEDGKYLMPVLKTLLQSQTGKNDDVGNVTWNEDPPMTRYGGDLVMGKNGSLMKLKVGDELSEAKYNTIWKAKSTITHLHMLSQLLQVRITGLPPFFLMDRITRLVMDWKVGSLLANLPDSYPACLDLLLEIIKVDMATDKHPVDALVRMATQQQNRIDEYKASGFPLSNFDISAQFWAKAIATDRVRMLHAEDRGNPAFPPNLHLSSNPILSGLSAFALQALMRGAMENKEYEENVINSALHYYNMARHIGGLQLVWEDAEFVIENLGCQKIFGRDTRPTTWATIYQSYMPTAMPEIKNDLLLFSKLAEILESHLSEHGDSDSLRKLQQVICRHLEQQAKEEDKKNKAKPPKAKKSKGKSRRGKKSAVKTQEEEDASPDNMAASTPQEKPENPRDPSAKLLIATLTKIIAKEERGWHFPYFTFRESQCKAVVAIAKDIIATMGISETNGLPHFTSIHLAYALVAEMNVNREKSERLSKRISEGMQQVLQG